MSSKSFSFRRLLMPWKKNKHTETKSGENELAIVSKTKENTSVEDRVQVMETNSKAKSSETPREVIPTKTQYIAATGEEALMLLQSAATFIPVPFIQEAIGVALKIIDVCENISVVGQKVNELQDRVCHLMVVVVDNVTPKNEECSDEVIMKAAKGIERDVKDLLSTLGTINEELNKITAQGPWLLGLYTDLNTSAVDDGLGRLSTALEKFKLANDLRDSDLLQELHARLAKVQNMTQQVSYKVDDVREDVKNVHKDIKQILAKTRRSATLRPSDAVAQQMPLKPGVFYGRDVIIEEIAQLLMKEETSRICILGPGGMGKTSVSLGVVEQPLVKARFLPNNCVWVPCIEATSPTLLLEILYTQLQVPGDKQVTIEKIISLLNASTQPHLILLDNFETPYNLLDGTQKQVEDILRRLAMLRHVAILVTMRGRYPPCDEAIKWQSKNIQPTDEAACIRIYRSIYPGSEDDRDVGKLLGVLGYLPFAVTLMARLAKEGRSTAEELLLAWSEYGPDILPDQEQSMNRSISLSVNSHLMRQNPQALLLLKVLSFLPAGTTKATLRWWVPALHVAMVPSAIATLFKAGLLIEIERQDSGSPVLFVLPVVQSFMQQHGRIEDEIRHNIQSSCCQYVLDHACRDDDPAFPIKSEALAAEDVNIQAILYGSSSMQNSIIWSDRAIEALVGFSWYRCDTKPNLEITKHAASMAKAFGNKKYIASTSWCLAVAHYSLGIYHVVYNYMQEAYQLFNALPPDDRELQWLCCRCGIDLVEAARVTFKDRDEAISLARDVEKKCATVSDDFQVEHGRSLIALGMILRENPGHRQEALRHLERAKLMLMGAASDYVMEACRWIAYVHYYENRLPEALDAMKEAWEHAKSSNMNHTMLYQVHISLTFGAILFSADRDTEAWKYVEISLMKCSQLGNRRDSGIALEYMGYGYLRRGDYLNAYGAYEAAVDNYLGTDAEEPFSPRCKDNMAKIKDKQRNPDLNVGFHRPPVDKDRESLFYPAVQDISG